MLCYKEKNKKLHGFCLKIGNGDGHVHFRTEEVARHDAEISIVCPEEGIQEVHLGFLQIRHVYDVTFSIVDDLGEEVNFDPLENLVVKVKSIVPNADGEFVAFVT